MSEGDLNEKMSEPQVAGSETSSVTESGRPAEKELELAGKAVEEFDGLVDGAKRLQHKDKGFSEQIRPQVSSVARIAKDADSREPGYSHARDFVDLFARKMGSRLDDYSKYAERMGIDPQQAKGQIQEMLARLVRTPDLKAAKNLMAQTINAFTFYSGKIAYHRQNMGNFRKEIKDLASSGAGETSSIKDGAERGSSGNLDEKMAGRLNCGCIKLEDSVQQEVRTVDSADRSYSKEIIGRRTRFTSLLESMLGLKTQFDQVQSETSVASGPSSEA